MNQLVRVTVTAEHLENGKGGSASCSPIALALAEVIVPVNAVQHHVRHLLVILNGSRYWLAIDWQTVELMRDHAAKVPVPPFTFLLQIPSALLNDKAKIMHVHEGACTQVAHG
jgi:hypothetical protein